MWLFNVFHIAILDYQNIDIHAPYFHDEVHPCLDFLIHILYPHVSPHETVINPMAPTEVHLVESDGPWFHGAMGFHTEDAAFDLDVAASSTCPRRRPFTGDGCQRVVRVSSYKSVISKEKLDIYDINMMKPSISLKVNHP